MLSHLTLPCGLCGNISEVMCCHEDVQPTETICNDCQLRPDVQHIFSIVEAAISGDSYLKVILVQFKRSGG